jgi:hypothetical protein
MTNGCPSAFVRWLARIRLACSAPPPVGNGMMIRTGFAGYGDGACANAAAANATPAIAASTIADRVADCGADRGDERMASLTPK